MISWSVGSRHRWSEEWDESKSGDWSDEWSLNVSIEWRKTKSTIDVVDAHCNAAVVWLRMIFFPISGTSMLLLALYPSGQSLVPKHTELITPWAFCLRILTEEWNIFGIWTDTLLHCGRWRPTHRTKSFTVFPSPMQIRLAKHRPVRG